MHIAVIDDEKLLNKNITKKLEDNWYKVSSFFNYNDFINTDVDLKYFDLFLIDIWLGDWSWFDIIKKIRLKLNINTPIIIISWYADKDNVVCWYNLWIDDYIKKPILPEELIFRVKNVLKRPKENLDDKILEYNEITLNVTSREVRKWKRKVILSKKETEILELFMQNRWKIIPKNDFIIFWWWEDKLLSVTDNTIYVTLSTLRKKLWSKFNLESKKNLGYILI